MQTLDMGPPPDVCFRIWVPQIGFTVMDAESRAWTSSVGSGLKGLHSRVLGFRT